MNSMNHRAEMFEVGGALPATCQERTLCVCRAVVTHIECVRVVHARPHLKALAQMGLHSKWILGLTQYLQKLIIGQEEEASKS